jgi:hypothetical protein
LDIHKESEESQKHGFVFVFDLKGLSFHHARSVGVRNSKKLSRFIQVRFVSYTSFCAYKDIPFNVYRENVHFLMLKSVQTDLKASNPKRSTALLTGRILTYICL